jgi:hypothetical protein
MNALRTHIGKQWALRLLLLLLLAVDWATDPFQGTSSLSQPLASTEVHCHSLQRHAEVIKVCAEAPWLCIPGSSTLVPACHPLPSRPRPLDATGPCQSLVYVFMSIRR